MELWKRVNYIIDQEYINNTYIYEYDIRAANVSVLRAYEKIDNDTYAKYLSMPKSLREYNIGMLIREEKERFNTSTVYDTIKSGIEEAKHQLFEQNNLQDSQIIRIASDAVYVSDNIGKVLQHTVVELGKGFVEFKVNGPWNTMVKFPMNTILFMGYTPDGDYNISVKGIDNSLLELHEPLLGFICRILFYIEHYSKKDTLIVYKDFYDKYINRELPIEYYREFNSGSSYRLQNSGIGSRFLDQKYLEHVDISYNNYILRTLYRIIITYMK